MKNASSSMRGPLGFVLLMIVAVLAIRAIAGGGVAPAPEMFDLEVSYEDAAARAAQSGKPVLVFATADWCGPCQTFKRGALKDKSVIAFATENTEPVYLDVDVDGELAQQFGVQGIPAMMIVRDGQVVDRVVGVKTAPALLAWMGSAVESERSK